MRTHILLILLLLLSLVAVALALGYSYADVKEVSGLVRDPGGTPVAGAVVSAGGRSALSDSAGRFQLSLPRGR